MRFITVIVLVILASLPEMTAAQGGLVPCTGFDCNFCTAAELVHNVGQWLVGILIVTATILLAITGVQMAATAGNSDAKQLLKERLQNIIIGFVLILAAWVIVDTLIKALVVDGDIRNNWATPVDELCSSMRGTSIVREGPLAPAEISPEELPEAVAEGTLTQSEAEELLAGSSIRVSSTGSCSDPNNRTCTSFSGIRPTTINRVKELQSAIGEEVVITGGTEIGHSADGTYTHGNGYKVDLRTTSVVNNYITSNYTSLGGNKYQDPHGNIYYRHGPIDHWDVTVVR